MKVALGILLMNIFLSNIYATDFRTCKTYFRHDQVGYSPGSLKIHGCDKMPCTAPKGATIHSEMNFTAQSGSRILKPDITAYIFNIPIPAWVPDNDACSKLITCKCPLAPGEHCLMKYKFWVPFDLPLCTAWVRISFKDEYDEDQICMELNFNVIQSIEISDGSASPIKDVNQNNLMTFMFDHLPEIGVTLIILFPIIIIICKLLYRKRSQLLCLPCYRSKTLTE